MFKEQFKVYWYLAIVAAFSLMAVFLPWPDIAKTIASMPLAAALIGAVYQILLNEAKHQKDLAMQDNQQTFELGAASHMSQVAFDKHVEFCEKYITEMYGLVETLFKLKLEQSTEDICLSDQLKLIRKNYAAWVTSDIARAVMPFERALDAAMHCTTIVLDETNDRRTIQVSNAYGAFSNVLGIDYEVDEIDIDVATQNIVNKLRKVLGIDEVTKLRKDILQKSAKIMS